MMMFAITYWELKDGDKEEKVEIYKEDEFTTFFNKAIFYNSRPFDFNDLKIFKGTLNEIVLKKLI